MDEFTQQFAPSTAETSATIDETDGELLRHHSEREDSLILAILKVLWPNSRFIARVAAIGLVIGVLIAVAIPNRYTATARLMPPDTQGPGAMAMLAAMGAKAGLPIGVGSDLLGVKSSGALFVGILQSRTIQDRLINRFDLRREYWRKTYQAAREKLASQTDIFEDRKTGIISIEVTDPSPTRAAQMAQAYVDELDTLVVELNTSAAHRERVFLEQRLNAVKQELDTAATEFSQFASKNTAIDIKEQGRAMVEAAAVLQGQLIAAQSELRGLQQIYTDENVRVRAVKARIGELQRQLEKLGGKGVSESSTANELYPSIRQLPLLGVRYADLYRRTKIEETIYETLTQQYELAKVQEVKETPSVRVLDRPQPPERKSFPPRLLILLGVTFLAFLVAAAWIIFAELWSEIDPEEPHKAFILQSWNATVPVLAHKFAPLRSRWHPDAVSELQKERES